MKKPLKTNNGEDIYLLGLERYGNLWYQNKEYESEVEVVQAAKEWRKDDVSNPVCILKRSIEVIKKFHDIKSTVTWGGYSYAILDLENIEEIK